MSHQEKRKSEWNERQHKGCADSGSRTQLSIDKAIKQKGEVIHRKMSRGE